MPPSSVMSARWYCQMNKVADARHEFKRSLDQSTNEQSGSTWVYALGREAAIDNAQRPQRQPHHWAGSRFPHGLTRSWPQVLPMADRTGIMTGRKSEGSFWGSVLL
jgi:hypothetical protein